jgi:hypothetical protein
VGFSRSFLKLFAVIGVRHHGGSPLIHPSFIAVCSHRAGCKQDEGGIKVESTVLLCRRGVSAFTYLDDHEERRIIMVEPITLAAVGTVALTEGIKFLYAQAGEVLKRWRERRDAAESDDAPPDDTARMDIKLPEAFEGQLSEPKIHFDVVERLDKDLRETRNGLTDYAQDIEKVDNSHEELLAKTDALRRLLEAVLQERITFKREKRPPSGPVVEGHIDVDEVAGYAAAVRAKIITSGHVKGEARASRVQQGGEFVGVDADTIRREE